MRVALITIATLVCSPLQAQEANTLQTELESEGSTDEDGENLCDAIPIACSGPPPPSKRGSDGGGIEAVEDPDVAMDAELYEFEVEEMLRMQAESIQMSDPMRLPDG